MNDRLKLLEYAYLAIQALRDIENHTAKEKMLCIERELGLGRKDALRLAFDEILKDKNLGGNI